MATLYLHIGTPKTGTTALQAFCWRNRSALMRRGYSYMRPPFFYPNASKERNGHFLSQKRSEADGSILSPRGRREWNGGMDAISAQFRRVPNVILSDEGIWNADQNGLWRDLRAESERRGFHVRVIVYLRRQDQFLSSRWGQRVKVPDSAISEMRFDDVLKIADEWTHLNYYRMLEGIAAEFGRASVVARIYDRSRFPDGDIVKDFLSILGIAPDEEFRFSPERNISLHGNVLEIKRIINSIPEIRANPEKVRLVAAVARRCSQQEGEGTRQSLFSPEERTEFLGRYEESNRCLARDYFGDAERELFPPIGDPLPKWDPHSPEMFDTIIRFFSIAAFDPPRDRFLLRMRRRVHDLRCALWRRRYGEEK